MLPTQKSITTLQQSFLPEDLAHRVKVKSKSLGIRGDVPRWGKPGWRGAEGTNSRAVRISEWWGHPQAQLTLLPCIPFNKHEGSTYCVLGRVPGQVLEPNCSCSNPSPAPQETLFSSFIGMQLTLTWCKFKVSDVMIRMSYIMK